jgi:MFS family permease
MDALQAVTTVTISGACVIGMVLALLGSIKLALARQLQVGEGRIGGLLSALNLALIPMMLLTGYLIDIMGVRSVLLLGSLITSAAIFSMSMAPDYKRAFTSILLLGLGLAAVSTAVVVLMPVAFFPSRGRHEESPALNMGHVFIALGALVTPVLADILLRTLNYRKAVMFLALLCLVPAFLCIVPPFGSSVDERSTMFLITDGVESSLRNDGVSEDVLEKLKPLKGKIYNQDQFVEELGESLDQDQQKDYQKRILKDANLARQPSKLLTEGRFWHLLLAGVVFLFYAPVEGAAGIWATTLLTESGYSERRAAVLLSCFWAAFLSSRLLTALLRLPSAWDPWLIAIPALFAAVVLGNLSASVGKGSVRNGLLLLGFLLGPIFPTLVGMLFQDFDQDRGTIYGFMFAIGSVGSMLMAPLIGLRMRNTSAHRAMRTTMVLALLLTMAAMVFALLVGPEIRSP